MVDLLLFRADASRRCQSHGRFRGKGRRRRADQLLRLHHTHIEAQWSGASPELDEFGALHFRSSRCRSTLSTLVGRSTTVEAMEEERGGRWRLRASEADFCPATAPGRRGVLPSGNRRLHFSTSFWSDNARGKEKKGGPRGEIERRGG